jgi:membrane-associated phospholipid phosphatase
MKETYKKLYEKNAAFYQKHPKAKKILVLGNFALTFFFIFTYGAFVLYAFIKPLAWEDWVKILLFPGICLALITVLRLAIQRDRPYSEKGANITPLLQKTGKDNGSFPSRHTACAFIISLVILAYFPWLGFSLFPFALLLSYARFALGLHYPTDLLGGAILAFVCGIPVLLF